MAASAPPLDYRQATPDWPAKVRPAAGAPNVLIILWDDVGFSQFGCYGSPIATPNIDRLAAQGVRYTNFHVAPVCSPTRAALLTGRNPHSVGMACITEFANGQPNSRGGIVAEAGTIADYERFTAMLVGRGELDGVRIVSPKTLDLMTANHLPGNQDLTQLSQSLFSESQNAGVGFGLFIPSVRIINLAKDQGPALTICNQFPIFAVFERDMRRVLFSPRQRRPRLLLYLGHEGCPVALEMAAWSLARSASFFASGILPAFVLQAV